MVGLVVLLPACRSSLAADPVTVQAAKPRSDREPGWQLSAEDGFGWESELAVFASGGEVSARVYTHPRGQFVLRWPGRSDWLVEPADGTVRLGPARPPIGRVEPGDRGVRMVTLAGVYRMGARTPLLGVLTAQDVLAERPSYRDRMSEHRADRAEIEKMIRVFSAEGSEAEPLEILILFGSWCPSCQYFVPKALSIERELGQDRAEVRYFALPPPEPGVRDPEAARLGVDRVPTAIVSRSGRELGRIVGPDGFLSFERSLRRLLEESR